MQTDKLDRVGNETFSATIRKGIHHIDIMIMLNHSNVYVLLCIIQAKKGLDDLHDLIHQIEQSDLVLSNLSEE